MVPLRWSCTSDGDPANKPAQVYVAAEDSSQHIGVVAYPDTAITGTTRWTYWEVPLSLFADVNLAKVKKMYLGVGDRRRPGGGRRRSHLYR